MMLAGLMDEAGVAVLLTVAGAKAIRPHHMHGIGGWVIDLHATTSLRLRNAQTQGRQILTTLDLAMRL